MIKEKEKLEYPLPHLTVTGIVYEPDKEDIYAGAERLQEEDPFELSSLLHIGVELVGILETEELHNLVDLAIRHNVCLAGGFIDAPGRIELQPDCIWDEELITEYISDSTGWLFSSYYVESTLSREDIQSLLETLEDDIEANGYSPEKGRVKRIYEATADILRHNR